MRGRYIIYEGIDLSGKSTMARMCSDWLRESGIKSIVAPQPGSTYLGKQLREIVKHDQSIKLGKITEGMIFALDHISFVETVLVETLNSGCWVLSDRHDFMSGLIYQVLNGVDPNTLKTLYSVANAPMADVMFILKASKDSLKVRAQKRADSKWDRYESNLAFMEKVREEYSQLLEKHKSCVDMISLRSLYINADKNVDEVFESIKTNLLTLI